MHGRKEKKQQHDVVEPIVVIMECTGMSEPPDSMVKLPAFDYRIC